jgi:hypothetical protein
MHTVGLHRPCQHRPALLVVRLTKQVFTPPANLVHQPLSATLGTPDAVGDQQWHLVCSALVGQVAHVLSRVDVLPQILQSGNHSRLSAQANASPCIRMG